MLNARAPRRNRGLRIIMKITSKVVTITPGMASSWLADNKFENRNLSDRNVNRIARDIKAGKWIFDGNPIRFDNNGNILDGQHRLWAIVMAEKEVESLVVRGLEEGAVHTIDTGKSRNNADVLHFAGYKSTSALAALARLAIGYRRNKGDMWKWAQDNSHARLSTQEILDEVEKNQVLVTILQHAQKLSFTKKLLGPATTAFAYYVLQKNCEDSYAGEYFFDAFERGINLREDDAILLLRNVLAIREDVLVARKQGGNKATAYKLALLIKAWNAYREKKPVKRLTWGPEKEAYPVPH